jgi:polyphosphate kinase
MPRNLYEPVEVMFPVKNTTLRDRIFEEILQTYLKDNQKSRILHPDGTSGRSVQADSSRSSRNGNRFSAQAFFIDLAEGKRATKSTVDEWQSPRTPKELPAAS